MITVLLYISSEVDLLLSCILDIITILHYYTFIYIHKLKYFMEVFCNQSLKYLYVDSKLRCVEFYDLVFLIPK